MKRLLRLFLTATILLPPTVAWNIGGHSPVKDLNGKPVQNALKYVMNEGSGSLSLPTQSEKFTLSVCSKDTNCKSCACLLSATKQVVAGINWVLVLKIVPKDQPIIYRRVTVYDKSFAGGKGDTYKITKSETISLTDAQVSSYTESALKSITNPNAQSDHHATASVTRSSSDPAKAYMDRLGKRTSGLVQHVTFTPKDCATGQKVQNGDVVSMHYTGTLANGKKFDSSYDRGAPFDFTVGANQVISGWEQSVPGMCVGEKSRLYVPSKLAYGDKGFGSIIPPNSNLIFDVEVMKITRK
jgi:FKBP-type peptidyl-prolyl cis-trans isomerase